MKDRILRKMKDIILFAVLSILLIIMVMPVLWTIFNAFKTNYEIMNHPFSLPKSLDFSNIIGAWKLANFKVNIINTTVTTASIVLLIIVFACPAAYIFAQMKFKGSNLLFYSLFMGLSIPNQTIIISVFYRMKALGLINSLWGYILLMVGTGMPFAIFLMRNTYKDLPAELRESAKIDGASEWKIFLNIFFPLGKSGVMALAVFTFISAWNEYLYPLVLLISSEKKVVSTAIVAFQASVKTNFAYIFGAAVISLLPSLIIYVLLQRSFIQGATVGATKG